MGCGDNLLAELVFSCPPPLTWLSLVCYCRGCFLWDVSYSRYWTPAICPQFLHSRKAISACAGSSASSLHLGFAPLALCFVLFNVWQARRETR
jgi:hypothetical protein